MEILTIKNLSFYYPEAEKPALESLSMSIDAGDFVLLCGHSGCGKSTLLRNIKPQLAPHGRFSGEIMFEGIALCDVDERESASKIGFVQQSPDNQIVTDKVWHELAFALESLGYDTPTIRRRVAEMASFFGIENWFYKNTRELSGGQKQLLNLAAVMVMQPKLLILDEPTSQLDPIAASDFIALLKRINRELGTTVILSEHRLEEALPAATKAAVMEDGRLLCMGSVADIGNYLKKEEHPMFLAMPAAMRIWGSVDSRLECPVSINEGREFLTAYTPEHEILLYKEKTPDNCYGNEAVSLSDVYFRYEKELPDVMRDVKLRTRSGEALAILGGNGTGKTTTLKVIAGLKKPYRGQVKINGRVGLLPQDPQTLFLKKSVYEDLLDALSDSGLSKEDKKIKLDAVIRLCRLSGLENRHPYDLSGGEGQRAALAKLLLTDPDILLLDEPTKGFDARFKAEFADILKSLTNAGVSVIMVSHDIEFCAEHADRVALFFDGNIVTEGTPHEFFSGNNFYTTSACRIARDIIPDAVTVRDVIESIGGRTIEKKTTDITEYKRPNLVESPAKKEKKLPIWRKLGAWIFGILSFCTCIYAIKNEKLTEMIGKDGMTKLGIDQLYLYGIIIVLLLLTALFAMRRSDPPVILQTPKEKRKLSKRTISGVVLILLFIPLTLFVGVVYIDRKQYYITALAILIECMLPFFMVFEGRKPKARELVIIASLSALSVAGRAAFFMLPQFKPVLAMTIIAGVAFGGETGFLVGAVSMLVSNMMFAQGPWTPWQMFAMGIIGFLAGILFRKGILRRSKASLCTFGALSAILIYGGITNPSSALIWGSESLNIKMIMTYYLTGFPMDCIHAAATVIFLLFLAEPMLEKLDRIKVKYGLVE